MSEGGRPGAPLPGLCGHCAYARVVRTRTGSVFHLCRRSATDARFPRYPPLPVRSCGGYEPAGAASNGPEEEESPA